MLLALHTIACGHPGSSATPTAHPIQSTAPHDRVQATLTGILSAGPVATGKSLATWNGFAVGEQVYFLTPDPDQGIETEPIMIHIRAGLMKPDLLNRRVRLQAVWVFPEAESDSAGQLQVPVSTAPGVSEVTGRRPTLRTSSIAREDG